ncbi:MBL fold metallo-hydrolase [Candidatus Bathyarchaeota archaeon]|nr:MAG: MBL fold metallo-hydrolase [Candidatus Hecatellales archaeon]RLI34659.1 MAG: MBL fold metallo-hydrolase [Candidatus Bathyarchaeota archaeon]
MKGLELVFLGTGGGRFAIVTQRRRTGGIRIIDGKVNLHLDPGPGALVYSIEQGLDPRKITGVLVSHAHPDHANDSSVLLEAMTGGALKRRGFLACARSVTQGNDSVDAVVSRYHKGLPGNVFELSPGDTVSVGGLEIRAVKAIHYDPDTIGFRLKLPNGETLGYTSDTEFFEGAGKPYRGVDVLILCSMRPRGAPLKWHMSIDDAIKILEEAKPKEAFLTHFGMRMLVETSPENEAKYVEKVTGIPTKAARDNMRVKIERKHGLTEFFQG